MTIATIDRPAFLPPGHSAGLSRLLWMDLARVVAAAWVVTIHVAAVPVKNIKAVPSDWWWWANLYESFSGAAVPLFVMLSGASLLTQDPFDMRQFFTRRLSKLLVPLIIWTLIYRAWGSWLGHAQTGGIVSNLMDGLDAPAYPHLWFLWMIASLYLLTPIFQPFAARGSVNTHIYFGSLWFLVTAIIPLLERWSDIRVGLQLNAAVGFIGYYVLGASLHRFTTERLDTRCFTICWLTFLSCFAITAGGTYALSQGEGRANESMMDASAGNIILMTFTAFLLLRHYGMKWTNARRATVWRTILTWGSSLSFGIYLLHPLIIDVLDLLGLPLDPMPFNTLWYVPLLSVLAFTVAGLSTALLQAVPGLRRLVP